MPKNAQKQRLIAAALDGSDSAAEELHALCADKESAQKVSEMLLALPAAKDDAIDPWLQAIAEMHPSLATELGAKQRQRLGAK